MKIQKKFKPIFSISALWILFAAISLAQTTSRLSTTIIARGEKAYLEVAVIGSQADEPPEIPNIKNITVQPTSYSTQQRMIAGRKVEYIYEYLISSYDVGRYVIPSIEIIIDGVVNITEPIDFMIFNPDELDWSSLESGGRTIRYASAFRTLNKKPFENETIPVEIKAFVPEDLVVEDWGIPAFERDGLTAWRFQPTPRLNRINLLGTRYISVSYPSTITPTRTGAISIGPAKIRLTTRDVVMDPFPTQVNREVYLEVPKLNFECKPLPEGAPKGFENAVGSFKISASATETKVQEGDPISVDLVVTGTGNLDTMKPPQLADSEGWKIYGTTADQRGEERRDLAGTMISHQSLRPLELKAEIPPFRLVYFDPKNETYQSVSTAPIPLQMTASNLTARPFDAAAPTLAVPIERMTDILGILRPSQISQGTAFTFPYWLGHVIPGLLALCLIAKALWMRYAPKFKKSISQETRLRELREIENTKSNSDLNFLKSSGSYIERWMGGNTSPEIQTILAERDAVCFQNEKTDYVLNTKRRGEILKLLRQATMVFIITALSFGTSARAEDKIASAFEAYDAAKYDDAIQLWLGGGNSDQLSADILYNVGNACYRSGSPGYAALYFRRALLRDPSHQEAQQNLRFIERKHGAITIQRPDYQYLLSKLPLTTWKNICWTGVWCGGLALLVFPATKTGVRLRVVAVSFLIIAPLLISIGFLGWHYFPNDSKFAPIDKQAVVIGEKAMLHVDAARTSPEVIDAPPGSLCEIIRESSGWSYVAFATKTRGWIPTEFLEKIIPEKTLTAPKFRKPKADGKTA